MPQDHIDPSLPIALPGFTFDPIHVELLTDSGDRVSLRPQAREVLRCLARNVGQVVTKEEFMHAVWPNVIVTDDSLVQCIAELRRALKDDQRRIVQTEPRRGYRLVSSAPVNGPAIATAPDPLLAFQQDIRFATTGDGVRIAYAISGTGLPLVRTAHWMTHLDWDWRSATFGPRLQALARCFRLVRYDGRGYGLSDRDVAPATLDEAVADLEAVVDAAGLTHFSLLGPSGGAAVAIRYAARHPQRVTRMVLLGGVARGMLKRGERSISQENCEAFFRLIEDGWGQDNPAFRPLMTSLLWPGASAQAMASFNQLQRVSCAPGAASALLRRTADFDATEDLPNVKCPTLVLHSPRDSRAPFEEGRLIAAMIPGARLEPFDSPNHTPLADEPAFEHVQQSIKAFLEASSLTVGESAAQAGMQPRLEVVDGERRGKIASRAARKP